MIMIKNKKNILKYLLIYIIVCSLLFILQVQMMSINIFIQPSDIGAVQRYYNNGDTQGIYFDEKHSDIINTQFVDRLEKVSFTNNLKEINKSRIDLIGYRGAYIEKIKIKTLGIPIETYYGEEIIEKFNLTNDVQIIMQGPGINVQVNGPDPYLANDNVITYRLIMILIFFNLIIGLIVLYLGKAFVKNIKKERLLVMIIGGMLIIPPLVFKYIAPDSIATTENRTLKKKPDLKLNNLFTYPSEFNAYFDDHIPFKSQIVKLNSYVKYNLMNVSPADYVIKGEDNWLFYNSKARNDMDALGDYLGTNHYTIEELELIKQKLLEKDKYLKEKGIEFYIMIGPNKEQIYSEYMPDYYNKQNDISRVDELVQYLEDNTDLKIVYPKKALINNKGQEYLYYKWDTHWNFAGGYIAFYELMQSMKELENIPSYHEINFQEYERMVGDLSNMINMTPSGIDYEYVANGYREHVEANLVKQEGNRAYYTSNSEKDKKIIMFRDSFGEAIIPYLSKAFSETIFTSDRYFDPVLIEQENPNVVIFEVVERGVDVLKN